MIADAEIASAIRALLGRRGADASICPSEVARALAPDWRPLMRPVREAALALAERGQLRITRGGVDVSLAALHCDEAQGYHLAKPMPFEAFTAWAAQREVANA